MTFIRPVTIINDHRSIGKSIYLTNYSYSLAVVLVLLNTVCIYWFSFWCDIGAFVICIIKRYLLTYLLYVVIIEPRYIYSCTVLWRRQGNIIIWHQFVKNICTSEVWFGEPGEVMWGEQNSNWYPKIYIYGNHDTVKTPLRLNARN